MERNGERSFSFRAAAGRGNSESFMLIMTETNLEWLIRRSKVWDAMAPIAESAAPGSPDDDSLFDDSLIVSVQ